MRRWNIILILLLVAIVIGIFTRPSREEFLEYVRKESETPPVLTSQTNGFAFSVFKVEYFEIQRIPATDSTGAKNVATTSKKASYLGLFGRFWKL
ncbi:MAG TPA: hypothetical protein VHM26_09755 [Chitinophagaceae bacterium]|nr:hypothetical protein [Chitinophagaceae bacterium]